MKRQKRELAVYYGPIKATRRSASQRGFSLVETTIALVVMMVVTLGVASLSSYAINYNSGGNDRFQAIAIAQREVERMRNARFTANVTDAVLVGGTHATLNVTGANGRPYTVDVVVDDDPATAGIQTDTTKTLKSITVTVTPRGAGPAWATNSAGSAVTIVTRRARLN